MLKIMFFLYLFELFIKSYFIKMNVLFSFRINANVVSDFSDENRPMR